MEREVGSPKTDPCQDVRDAGSSPRKLPGAHHDENVSMNRMPWHVMSAIRAVALFFSARLKSGGHSLCHNARPHTLVSVSHNLTFASTPIMMRLRDKIRIFRSMSKVTETDRPF